MSLPDAPAIVAPQFSPAAFRSREYRVEVNGTEVFVHESPIADIAIFTMAAVARVAVTPLRRVDKVDLRPRSLGLQPTVAKNVIEFVLTRPATLSVEVNRDIHRPLLLFANAPAAGLPAPDAPGVRFFGAGRIHEAGAIVRGCIRAHNAHDIRICGQGILDGSWTGRMERRMVELGDCRNVRIEGITIHNSRHWTVVPVNCDDVAIAGIRLVNGSDCDDGIDIVGCRDVTIARCFIRTKDDCIAIKANQYRWMFASGVDRDVRNVRVTDSVFWNAEWGNALEIGFETRTAAMSDILFRNCDIIHVEADYAGSAFSIHNSDKAVVSNVRYEDIRVEDAHDTLFDFKVMKSRYTRDGERGHIRGIVAKDVRVTGGRVPKSVLEGFDADHCVVDITFENLMIHENKVTDLHGGRFSVKDTRDVRFV